MTEFEIPSPAFTRTPDPYIRRPTKARILAHHKPRGDTWCWLLDGIDAHGYTEECWMFDSWADALAAVPEFFRSLAETYA